MIGDITIIDGRYYLQTNAEGTLEKLLPIKWYRQLWIYLLNYLGIIKSVHDVKGAWK